MWAEFEGNDGEALCLEEALDKVMDEVEAEKVEKVSAQGNTTDSDDSSSLSSSESSSESSSDTKEFGSKLKFQSFVLVLGSRTVLCSAGTV